MVLLVKAKNNTDALKAINIARQTLNITHPKTIKYKRYVSSKTRYLNNLTKGVLELKKNGYQVKQIAFNF